MSINNNAVYHKIDTLLSQVQKPGRYVGGEVNSIIKDPGSVKVRVALAFPDVYELGMSYTGFQILYHLLNREPDIAAERVYAPWPDMESVLRKAGLPLFSLESRTPLCDFDLLGFTLQYELHFTNILMMLDLGGIPVHAVDRTLAHPVVIAGGPCAFNPEPIADFLDAVVLGDGEEVAIEIAAVVSHCKEQGRSRDDMLLELANVPGVYVPRFYQPRYSGDGRLAGMERTTGRVPETVHVRVVPELKNEFYPDRPVIPTIETTHGRYSLEVMRGCTQGCRFCSAGYIYRPTRERKVEDLIQQARNRAETLGYDEISLTSLSTTDYSQLPTLIDGLTREFTSAGLQADFSFPSLRPDRFTRQMADFAASGKKSGVTLACEAGTERLRRVINKNITEDGVLQSARNAFERGYQTIKLYFMIGLPTETDEDVLAIPELALKIWQEGRNIGARPNINLSVGPFAPKSWTPFQWEAQNPVPELRRKIGLIRDALRGGPKFINFKWRDPTVSFMEGVFGMADRRCSAVIEEAYRRGARFDGWTDMFDAGRWDACFTDAGIDPARYVQAKSHADALPWDHIDKGLTKAYLIEEHEKAVQESMTGDCRDDGCGRCGVMDIKHCTINDVRKFNRKAPVPFALLPGAAVAPAAPVRHLRLEADVDSRRIRLLYAKSGRARHISHLDMMQTLTRAIRRARIPMEMTRGYHPHPKVSHGPPLPTGYLSVAETMDVYILTSAPGAELCTRINAHLPEGLAVTSLTDVPQHAPAYTAQVRMACYRVELPDEDMGWVAERLADTLTQDSLMITRPRQGQRLDVRPFVEDLVLLPRQCAAEVQMRFLDGRTAKVEEVFSHVLQRPVAAVQALTITRTAFRLHPAASPVSAAEPVPA